jgi:hypothetical protein
MAIPSCAEDRIAGDPARTEPQGLLTAGESRRHGYAAKTHRWQYQHAAVMTV